MRVRFTGDFDWTPPQQRQVTLAFLAGEEKTVKRDCGEAAIKAGKAEEVTPPGRDEADAGRG
jgi:hypothetical protein